MLVGFIPAQWTECPERQYSFQDPPLFPVKNKKQNIHSAALECCQREIYCKDRHTGVFALRGMTGLGSDLRAGLGSVFDTVGSVSTWQTKEAVTDSDNWAKKQNKSWLFAYKGLWKCGLYWSWWL